MPPFKSFICHSNMLERLSTEKSLGCFLDRTSVSFNRVLHPTLTVCPSVRWLVLLLLDLVFVVFSLTASAIVLVLVQLCQNSLETLILPPTCTQLLLSCTRPCFFRICLNNSLVITWIFAMETRKGKSEILKELSK